MDFHELCDLAILAGFCNMMRLHLPCKVRIMVEGQKVLFTAPRRLMYLSSVLQHFSTKVFFINLNNNVSQLIIMLNLLF